MDRPRRPVLLLSESTDTRAPNGSVKLSNMAWEWVLGLRCQRPVIAEAELAAHFNTERETAAVDVVADLKRAAPLYG
jgi:hypothetical protein